MTSTEFTVGLGEGARVSSKVLKPPGGGSSDIFGLGNPHIAGKPTSEKQFKCEDSSTHSRVFGSPLNDFQLDSQTTARNGSEADSIGSGFATLPAKQNNKVYIQRNPITGEEIKIGVEGEGICDKDDDTEAPNAPVKQVQTSIRVRNPPGGKSSGIF